MSESDRIEDLAATLENCLATLDELGADVAAAHVEAALGALRRKIDPPKDPSTTE